MKRKRKKDGYLSTGTKAIVSTIAVGSIPNISGTAAETTMKEKYAEGMGNVGKVFPAMGSMIGAGMVLKHIKKLKYPLKKK